MEYQELRDYLSRFKLPESIEVIGKLSSLIPWEHGSRPHESDPRFNEMIDWVLGNCKSVEDWRRLQLGTYRLARFILLSTANAHKKVILGDEAKTLMHSLNLVSRIHDGEMEKPPEDRDPNLWFYRQGQQQITLQGHPGQWIPRAFALFCTIPEKLGLAGYLKSVHDKYFEMSIKDHFSTGFCLYVLARGKFLYQGTTKNERFDELMHRDNLLSFAREKSCTQAEYKQFIRGEESLVPDLHLDINGPEPLLVKPIVRFHEDEGNLNNYFIPSNHYLMLNCTYGLFYSINDKLRESEGEKSSEEFRRIFGKEILPEYIWRHLNQNEQEDVNVVNLDDFPEYANQLRPDFAIAIDNKVILLEVKLTIFSVKTRYLANREEVAQRMKDKNASITKGIEQLKAFEDRILKFGFQGRKITKVVNILVSYDPMYFANALLLDIAEEQYGQKKLRNFQFATLADIETIGQCLFSNCNVVDAMIAKTEDKDHRQQIISQYLEVKFPEIEYEGTQAQLEKTKALQALTNNDAAQFLSNE